MRSCARTTDANRDAGQCSSSRRAPGRSSGSRGGLLLHLTAQPLDFAHEIPLALHQIDLLLLQIVLLLHQLLFARGQFLLQLDQLTLRFVESLPALLEGLWSTGRA